MKLTAAVAALLACALLSACAPRVIFTPEAMTGVDPDFDFTRWRMLPNQAEARKILLGGMIIQSDVQSDTITIATAQLPIVESPAYGPKDTGKRSGEFAIVYRGKLESSFLQPGNRVMVVGTTHEPKIVVINDSPRNLPTVMAQCLHLWKTGGRDIADFPSFGGGYEPLEEQTFCTTAP